MTTYLCRRFRRGYRKGIVKGKVARFRSRLSRRIVQILSKSLSRRSGLRKNAGFFKLFSSSSFEGRFVFSRSSSVGQSFKTKPRKLLTAKNQSLAAFAGLKAKQRLSFISTYRASSFQNGSKKRLNLLLGYNARNVNQDSDYFILSKLDLFEFGLPEKLIQSKSCFCLCCCCGELIWNPHVSVSFIIDILVFTRIYNGFTDGLY